MSVIDFSEFEKVNIRVGKIVSVVDYPEARNPSYAMTVDLGPEIGIKKSIAQLKANYSQSELEGMYVACVVNFQPRQIGKKVSEVLIVGFPDEAGNAVIVSPTKTVPLGGKLY